MALTEFELIARYLSSPRVARSDVILGVGDDCALLRVPAGSDLAVTMDTLVEGTHFSAGVDPAALGHKALAVNLSDLAAMGATPAWATLALTMPFGDPEWMHSFSEGFLTLADRYQVQLVGGDTTRGPLTVTVQVHGFIQPGLALRRDAARPGDLIGVSGTLGDAGLALQVRREGGECPPLLGNRLDRPVPRIELGRALTGIAGCAIDISDGLLADLGHICAASGAGARLELERLPLSPMVRRHVQETQEWSLPLAAGDDYELCFSVAPDRRLEVERALGGEEGGVTWIGVVEQKAGIRCIGPDGREMHPGRAGYEHFLPAG